MYDVSVSNPSGGPASVDRFHNPGDLNAWLRLADILAEAGNNSGLPESLQNQPKAVFMKMMHAQALDINIMMAVQDTFVIDQHVGMKAELMRALAVRSGHWYSIDTATPTECVMTLHRREFPGTPIRASWTIEEAVVAGLADKTVWTRYPRDLLFARCTSRLMRRGAPDVMRGFGYVREELESIMADAGQGQWIPSGQLADTVAAYVADIPGITTREELGVLARKIEREGLMQQYTADGEPLRAMLLRHWRMLGSDTATDAEPAQTQPVHEDTYVSRDGMEPARTGTAVALMDDNTVRLVPTVEDHPVVERPVVVVSGPDDAGSDPVDIVPEEDRPAVARLVGAADRLMTGCGCRMVEFIANGDHNVGCAKRTGSDDE